MNDFTQEHYGPPCDEALMSGLAEHKPKALEQLYQRHRTVLRNVVMGVMHDEVETDEVLQDVFVQVWDRADSYSPTKGRPLGWMITMARRRAIDRKRRLWAYGRAIHHLECECGNPEEEFLAQHSAERETSRSDFLDFLDRLMQRLPPNQKQVVEMAFFQNMSQREIARRLDLPLGTVKTRIELGLHKLAVMLLAMRNKVV